MPGRRCEAASSLIGEGFVCFKLYERTLTKGWIAVLVFGPVFAVVAARTVLADDGQLSDLTGQWWQFMLSTPASVNPLVDLTRVDCIVGQRGSVWFLGGTFSGSSAMRTYFVQRANGCSFQLAGVCRSRVAGSEPSGFITSKANRLIEGIQDRMPTILDESNCRRLDES